MTWTPANWKYPAKDRRDSRLDLLRGFAVFAMICDHVAGISWLSPLTGANRFVTSAAEGFVLLAGLVIGLVYGPRIARSGWIAVADPILRRAAVLYGVTVGLTLLFVGLFQFTDVEALAGPRVRPRPHRPAPARRRARSRSTSSTTARTSCCSTAC